MVINDYIYVKVHVKPGAKKEKVEQTRFDHFDISVKEEAKNNMANTRVREIIAQWFEVPTGKVRIISGHHSASKILSVDTG